ncbi:MAG TPA: hypothetical protein P5556_00840 [Candidatus Gastranaerophilales bacterium]|nr:hypothetical protein [Candidatus Gastranaerophilales bacterium]
MIKVTMSTLPELREVQVNPQDIEIKDGKYYVNGIQHSITVSGAEILHIFYQGAQFALDKKVTKKQAAETLTIIKR